MNIPAREKSDAPYAHRFHAGNVGDVFKHAVLLSVLDAVASPRTYVETHAGAGRYRVGPVGEWTEGIGRLLAHRGTLPDVVERLVSLVRVEGKTTLLPGSPLVAASALGADDRAIVVERDEETARLLGDAVRHDRRFTVRSDDGVRWLAEGLDGVDGDRPIVALVDPPFVEKREWTDVPRALVAAHRRRARLVSMLWYPVKSHTRPNALLAAVEKEGIAGFAVELVTAPLAVKKNRLAGSGLVVLGAPDSLAAPLGALMGDLGPRLALHAGFFSSRIVSWGIHTPRGDEIRAP